MWARVARFDGDPATVEAAVKELENFPASGAVPPDFAGARMLMLADRDSGARLVVSLFETEEAMRKGDAAMNAANPDNAGNRTAVEFCDITAEVSF
jgi:hypothetical protein